MCEKCDQIIAAVTNAIDTALEQIFSTAFTPDGSPLDNDDKEAIRSVLSMDGIRRLYIYSRISHCQ